MPSKNKPHDVAREGYADKIPNLLAQKNYAFHTGKTLEIDPTSAF